MPGLYDALQKSLTDPVLGMGVGLLGGQGFGSGLQQGLQNATAMQQAQFRQSEAMDEMLRRAEYLRLANEAAAFKRQQARQVQQQRAQNVSVYGVPEPTSRMLEASTVTNAQGAPLRPGMPGWNDQMKRDSLVTVNTAEVPQQAQPMAPAELQAWGLPADTVAFIDDKGNPKIIESGKDKGAAYQSQAQIEASLNNYRSQLQKYGPRVVPSGDKLKLRASYNDLLLEAKELYNLGVLQGPDLELMNQVMQDPTMWTSQIYTGDEMLQQLDSAFGNKVQNARKILDQRYGEQTAPQATTVDWNDL